MKFLILLCISFLSLPGLCQEDDELLNKLEADRRKQMEMALKLDQLQNNLKESAFNAPLELKKLGVETLTMASLMDEKVIKVVQKMFKESPLINSTPDEVRSILLEKAKGKPFEAFLKNNPKITNVLVDILRDKEALSSLMGIFAKKAQLKIYGIIWVLLLLIFWFIKKIFFSEKWSRGKRFFRALALNLIFTCTTFSMFYCMFDQELNPTTKIVVKHWRMRNIRT